MKYDAFELAYGGMGKLYECVDKTFGVVENCILIFFEALAIDVPCLFFILYITTPLQDCIASTDI